MGTPRAAITNLFRNGWEDSAREVYRRVRSWNAPMALFAKPNGDLSGRPALVDKRFHSAGAELIGTYTSAVQINEVEDDLIEYMRDLTARPVE